MDKFKKGERVICVAPHPMGKPGFWGRRGVVTHQRDWWNTDRLGRIFCYGVEFDGESYEMAALEWELLPDTPEGVDEVRRREEIMA